MVVLGRANSRMKDYYDVWMLTSSFELEPERMRRAVAATFARRNTKIPIAVPDGLRDVFAADAGKQRQWEAFAGTLSGQVRGLDQVVRALRDSLWLFITPNTDRP